MSTVLLGFSEELPLAIQVFSAQRKGGICGEHEDRQWKTEDQEVLCWVGSPGVLCVHAMSPTPELGDLRGSCLRGIC